MFEPRTSLFNSPARFQSPFMWGKAPVHSIRFQESDPSNSEVALDPTRRRATASAGATDVMSPWRNTPFFDEMLQWTVWREGRSIKALSSVEKVPATIDLPAEPDFLVH